jgi:hypothetical protein
MLASLNRRSENVGIEPIVVAELKFGDVQRHVFCADLVEAPDDAAFEDRPEALGKKTNTLGKSPKALLFVRVRR